MPPELIELAKLLKKKFNKKIHIIKSFHDNMYLYNKLGECKDLTKKVDCYQCSAHKVSPAICPRCLGRGWITI